MAFESGFTEIMDYQDLYIYTLAYKRKLYLLDLLYYEYISLANS